jgi:hypothetical protein
MYITDNQYKNIWIASKNVVGVRMKKCLRNVIPFNNNTTLLGMKNCRSDNNVEQVAKARILAVRRNKYRISEEIFSGV